MNKYSLLIVIATAQKIVMDLLTILIGEIAAAELMAGGVTTAAPGGVVGNLITSKTSFDSDPAAFAASQVEIDGLDDVVDSITAIEIGDFATEAGEAYDELQAASPEA